MRRVRAVMLWVVPVVALSVGSWLLSRPTATPAVFGWTAYAPLSKAVYAPGMASTLTIAWWGAEQWTGVALAAAGILTLTFLAGRASVRARRR